MRSAVNSVVMKGAIRDAELPCRAYTGGMAQT